MDVLRMGSDKNSLMLRQKLHVGSDRELFIGLGERGSLLAQPRSCPKPKSRPP